MGNPRARPKGDGGRARILAANNCGSKNCARHNIITFGCCGGLAKGVSIRRWHRLLRCSYATKLRPEASAGFDPKTDNRAACIFYYLQTVATKLRFFRTARAATSGGEGSLCSPPQAAPRKTCKSIINVLRSASCKSSYFGFRFFISLTSSKILPFGKLQASLHLLSLIRIFAVRKVLNGCGWSIVCCKPAAPAAVEMNGAGAPRRCRTK